MRGVVSLDICFLAKQNFAWMAKLGRIAPWKACCDRLRTVESTLRKCLETPCPEYSERQFHGNCHIFENGVKFGV